VVVFVALFMVCLLGVAALVIDIGQAYLMQRKTQAAADASAVAAATVLPDRSAATTAADYYAAKNLSRGTVRIAFSNTAAQDDTATATATVRSPSVFARLFGVDILKADATASAVSGTYTAWAAGLGPWATDRQDLTFGTRSSFKVEPGDQASPGNFGAVDLPVREAGCNPGNGDSDYVDLVRSGTHSCAVSIGDSLTPQPGNLGLTTATALHARRAVNGFDPYGLLHQQADGTYQLTSYDDPNLVVIPVLASFGNGSSDPLVVTGFAWFIITDYTSDTVTGMFVRSRAPVGAVCPTAGDRNALCPVGALDPDGLTVVRLAK
jgi:hypothetical protein